MSTSEDNDRLLTSHECSELLGISEPTLRAWRRLGRGPQALRLSPRCVRYRRRDVERWLEHVEMPVTDERAPGE